MIVPQLIMIVWMGIIAVIPNDFPEAVVIKGLAACVLIMVHIWATKIKNGGGSNQVFLPLFLILVWTGIIALVPSDFPPAGAIKWGASGLMLLITVWMGWLKIRTERAIQKAEKEDDRKGRSRFTLTRM